MTKNIVIYTLSQAIEELKKAEESGEEIVLQSPPDAVYYAGSLYYLKLFEQAAVACPYSKAIFILDCADAGAEVIAAMRDGHKNIRVNPDSPFRDKLISIAGKYGTNIC
ncbi:MAG: hypothetical protein R3D71_09795 [Rickettsiales bacterium]